VIKVLVVDDSALMRRVLSGILTDTGEMDVTTARDGQEALARLHDIRPDVVTLDVNMPNMNGLDCLDRIMIERPCPVVMVSSLTATGAEVTLSALHLGAVDFLAKPAGAISLALDDLAPVLIEKVRGAARARISPVRRLTERVRARIQTLDRPARRPAPEPASVSRPLSATSDAVVLVGTSTGGPPALEALLTRLPQDFPWPIVVAQHMPAAFTGPLARRLDRACALSVIEVTSPHPLAPGYAYIGHGDSDILIARRQGAPVVMAAPASQEHRWHPSVERLVRSAMAHFPAASLIGVLMTGMGNDGAAAMTELRQAGGHTIAESEDSAVVWGMPGELVKAGGAEEVLKLDRIAARLLEWAQ
jgi:two-component system chemotaxis response regulator CheB